MNNRRGYIWLLGWLLLFGIAVWSGCDDQTHERGEALYLSYCAPCHMEDGTGLRSLYPPLAQSDYLAANREQLPCIIRNGLEGEIVVNGKTYDLPMAGIRDLTEFEIVLIINYINNSWGNDAGYTDYKEVESTLSKCR